MGGSEERQLASPATVKDFSDWSLSGHTRALLKAVHRRGCSETEPS